MSGTANQRWVTRKFDPQQSRYYPADVYPGWTYQFALSASNEEGALFAVARMGWFRIDVDKQYFRSHPCSQHMPVLNTFSVNDCQNFPSEQETARKPWTRYRCLRYDLPTPRATLPASLCCNLRGPCRPFVRRRTPCAWPGPSSRRKRVTVRLPATPSTGVNRPWNRGLWSVLRHRESCTCSAECRQTNSECPFARSRWEAGCKNCNKWQYFFFLGTVEVRHKRWKGIACSVKWNRFVVTQQGFKLFAAPDLILTAACFVRKSFNPFQEAFTSVLNIEAKCLRH